MLKQCKNHVWRLLATKMQLRWRLASGLEVFVKSYADWCMYNEIFVNGEYTTAVRKLLQDGGKAPVRVFDLGANLGFFAIYLVNAFALSNRAADLRLCLVEGAPRVAEELKTRIAEAAEFSQIDVVSGLVGKPTGTARLNLSREDVANYVGSNISAGTWKQYRGFVDVQYVDIATLKWPDEELDLIKCDIEGSEFEFIANYPELLRRTKLFVVEFHAPFGNVEHASARLQELGFAAPIAMRDSSTNPVKLFVNQLL
jgi:FkbM family methyltransferase